MSNTFSHSFRAEPGQNIRDFGLSASSASAASDFVEPGTGSQATRAWKGRHRNIPNSKFGNMDCAGAIRPISEINCFSPRKHKMRKSY